MALLSFLTKNKDNSKSDRSQAWLSSLRSGQPPSFVVERLQGAATGKVPWTSTMTAAELLLSQNHGFRPLGVVTGTCWLRYAQSWTEGHATGWSSSLNRLKQEAIAAGANAVIDVKMRTSYATGDCSMDFTLLGTAIRIDGLPPSSDPVCATCPAFEFVRLVECGIVPLGIACGAYYDWFQDLSYGVQSQLTSWNSCSVNELTKFWENARRVAHARLREETKRQGGSGVLADVQFGQLFQVKQERNPTRYLGRHIVIGTVIDSRAGETIHHDIKPVLDLRDELATAVQSRNAKHPYSNLIDREGSL